MSTVEGSCFCQSVKYLMQDIEPTASICHCGFCRKLHGSDYSVWVSAPLEKFKLTEGETLLSTFKAAEYTTSYFCSLCGTKVYSIDSRYNYASVLCATITSPLNIGVTKQWFLEDKLNREIL